MNTEIRIRSVAVTIAGAILFGIGILFAIALASAIVERGWNTAGLILGLCLATVFAYTGAAMVGCWKDYQLKSKTVSFVMIAIGLVGGFAELFEDVQETLVPAAIMVILFGFVLWALHREA